MCLLSKHQSTGDLGEMRYPNRFLSKNLPLCTCSYPFYSAYNSLNHWVNFGQFKLYADIKKNPGPSVYMLMLQKQLMLQSRKCYSNWGKCWTTMCRNKSVHFNLQRGNKDYFS